MIARRALLAGAGALVCLPVARRAQARLPPITMERHEQAMRLAIEQGKRNAFYPFGAVITRADSGAVMGAGVNNTRANPILHGEIACMNDYVARNGSTGWDACVLYTTAEPCPMCMSALAWAGIGGVVFGTSIASLKRFDIDQIDITSRAVINAAPFFTGSLLGGVLEKETDQLFRERRKS
jgi:tRNA(Arg) A34 adenosine deaminase TadA